MKQLGTPPPPPPQVGPKELSQYHEELKNLKSNHAQSCDSLKRVKKEMEGYQRENNLLQRDVDRFRNKERYERDIKHLTYKKYWMVSRGTLRPQASFV